MNLFATVQDLTAPVVLFPDLILQKQVSDMAGARCEQSQVLESYRTMH